MRKIVKVYIDGEIEFSMTCQTIVINSDIKEINNRQHLIQTLVLVSEGAEERSKINASRHSEGEK